MAFTNAEKQQRQRERVKAKLQRLARLEAALTTIAEGWAKDQAEVARQALAGDEWGEG